MLSALTVSSVSIHCWCTYKLRSVFQCLKRLVLSPVIVPSLDIFIVSPSVLLFLVHRKRLSCLYYRSISLCFTLSVLTPIIFHLRAGGNSQIPCKKTKQQQQKEEEEVNQSLVFLYWNKVRTIRVNTAMLQYHEALNWIYSWTVARTILGLQLNVDVSLCGAPCGVISADVSSVLPSSE